MKKLPIIIILLFLLIFKKSKCQNETKQWYFGTKAGLDFNSSPPTVILNSAMISFTGCASMADSSGNLLFYTKGDTIWNRMHQVMVNGTGINGDPNFTQSTLILKQPGSNSLYYVFTRSGQYQIANLSYSIVDMTAAAGMGSVTVKNYSIYTGAYSENLTATKHCNGNDYWIIIANKNFLLFSSYQFYIAYKLSAVGFNTTAVVSSFTTQSAVLTGDKGAMKVSPNGKKIGLANHSTTSRSFELVDFDNSNGQVTNPLEIGSPYGYGCEFSPDGSKFYGSLLGPVNLLSQWDLSLGTNVAIEASETVIGILNGSMQLASNGKIYGAQFNQQFLAVINNPNLTGNLCNFIYNGQSLGSNYSNLCLPNFAGSFFNAGPSLTFSSTGGLSMCLGETKTLNVTGATSYFWNGSVSGASLVISPNITSTYSVIGTTSSGCIYNGAVTVTVSNCVGLNENSMFEIIVFPNPTNGGLNILYGDPSGVCSIKIIDLRGQMVYSDQIKGGAEYHCNISTLPASIYIIELQQENKIIRKKLIKTN